MRNRDQIQDAQCPSRPLLSRKCPVAVQIPIMRTANAARGLVINVIRSFRSTVTILANQLSPRRSHQHERTGNHNQVGSHNHKQQQIYLDWVFAAIEMREGSSPEDQADLKSDLKELKAEDAKGPQADEGFISKRLRNIRRSAPDILDVVLATIASPGAGFGLVTKKVADRMRAEAAQD